MTEEEWSISSEVEDCEPTPEELDNIFNLLDRGGTVELKWRCPGKRAPSPVRKEEVKSVETPEQKAKLAKEMEFDFMDDVSLPSLSRHRQQQPKTSTKKKTNFDGVINQMRKHGRLTAPTNQQGASGGANQSSGNSTTTTSSQ